MRVEVPSTRGANPAVGPCSNRLQERPEDEPNPVRATTAGHPGTTPARRHMSYTFRVCSHIHREFDMGAGAMDRPEMITGRRDHRSLRAGEGRGSETVLSLTCCENGCGWGSGASCGNPNSHAPEGAARRRVHVGLRAPINY